MCKVEISAPRFKFCSTKCSNNSLYAFNDGYRQRAKESTKKWEEENPIRAKILHKRSMTTYMKTDKFRKVALNNYHNNKGKWRSRDATRKIIKGEGYKKHEIKNKECKLCSSKNNIEIHHEIYPTKAKEIRNAIDQGKIYYLCKSCHGVKRMKKIKKV